MDYKKERKRIIGSAKIALAQLDKLIRQDIDLEALDPEKAKAAAQGKIEAIEGSFKIVTRLEEEIELISDKVTENKQINTFFGVENKVQ